MEFNEKVRFRLFCMPCCGQQLCWVNPRLPNHCPECGARVYIHLKTGRHTLIEQELWLRTASAARDQAAQQYLTAQNETKR